MDLSSGKVTENSSAERNPRWTVLAFVVAASASCLAGTLIWKAALPSLLITLHQQIDVPFPWYTFLHIARMMSVLAVTLVNGIIAARYVSGQY